MQKKMPSRIRQKIDQIVRVAGGSTLSKNARSASLRAFFSSCKNELNIQMKGFEGLKIQHAQAYVDHLKKKGVGVRTIQNNLVHIRAGLKQAGREHFAKNVITNATLGASGSSRSGTHRPISDEKFTEVKAALLASGQQGAAAALTLQRELGLRMREAISCVKSLPAWEKALAARRSVDVLHGTKGGRSRTTGAVIPARALEAVKNAREAAKQGGGMLMQSKSLEGACRAYQRALGGLGMVGELASHSLRCAYAKDRFAQHFEANGGDRREALAATSLDLGHGDGRGIYVAQVYLR